jgi:peptidoglycan L-alanyl-D-glutamate endopeptidase CwlK
MPSRNLEDLVGELVDAWRVALLAHAVTFPDQPQPFITCTYRSPEEQLELYAQGRTAPGKIVTQLKSGSKHNTNPSRAFDIAFQKDGKMYWDKKHFIRFAGIIKSINPAVKWGGDWKKFKDYPHFEI